MSETEAVSKAIRSEREAQPLTWMFWRKRRYIVVLLAFLGYMADYSMRVDFSIAIVAMTENRTVHYGNGTTGYEQYFDWNSQERGIILSSFYWGYIITQLAGGILAKTFGGNLIFGLGIGLTAILTLLTPWLGRTVPAMIVIRILQGVFEGVTFPCIQDIWFHWAPISERSRMVAIAYSGILIGTVLTIPLSALLANTLGWESIFYVFGVFGVLWNITWVVVVKSSPDKDRFISKDELDYIRRETSVVAEKKQSVPWKSLILSKPVYAITAAHTADNWGFYSMSTQMPIFLSDTLNYNLESSGLLSAAPTLLMSVLIAVAGFLADIFQNRRLLTTTQVRKYFNCGSFVVQMVCMFLAGFLIHRVWSVVFIIIGVGAGGFAMTGYSINPLDIAPAYASVVLGYSNTFATLPAMISPALTGYLVQNHTVDEWRIVFYITAGVYVFGIIVYWFWCSGEVQYWALPKSKDVDQGKQEK